MSTAAPVKPKISQRKRKNLRKKRVQKQQQVPKVMQPQGQRKKGGYAKKEKKEKQTGLNFTGTQATSNQIGASHLVISQPMNFDQLSYALAALNSRLLLMGATNERNSGTPNYVQMAQGLSYLLNDGVSYASGANVTLNRLPKIFEVIFSLLRQKTVRFFTGTIQYTPEIDPNLTALWTFQTDIGTVYTYTPIIDQNTTVTMQTGPITPDQSAYAFFLTTLEGQAGYGMTVVDIDPAKTGKYYSDPSAFARTYVYFGSGGSAVAGMYAESELEVNFKYPLFSKFVPYDTTDKVVSRVFKPVSGGLATPVGISAISQTFNENWLKNPIPPIYKCLNLLELVDLLTLWAGNVLDRIQIIANQNQNPGNVVTYPGPFSFTQWEFVFMVRQAVLSQFPEQCHAQFVAPIRSSGQNNVFQPLIVDTVGTPTAQSDAMIFPTFLVENLSMLRYIEIPVKETAKSKAMGSQPKCLHHVTCPVWGVYSEDTPIDVQFIDGPGTKSLFLPAPGVVPPRYSDCLSPTSQANKHNPNVNFKRYVAEWNDFCNTVGSQVSRVSSLVVDTNPRVSLLHYTRNLTVLTEDIRYPNAEYKNKYDYAIGNWPRYEKEKKVKGPIKALPPATATILSTRSLTGYGKFVTDSAAALNYLLIPTIRFDEGPPDVLLDSNYRVYTGETGVLMNNEKDYSSMVEARRLQTSAYSWSQNLLSNSNAGNTQTGAVNYVVDHGLGADFLSMLAGMIPVVGPALSALLN